MRKPDSESGGGCCGQVVPIFPLPSLFLFPGCVIPLHVFEPRYRQMIEDLLDTSGRLVMGTILEGQQCGDGAPEVFPVACLGEIGRHERLPDGRFLIWLIGLARVRIREVKSAHPYRLVEARPLEETPVAPLADAALRPQVQQALLERCSTLQSLPADLPLSHMVDLLLQRLGLPQSRMQELYAQLDVARRAEGALLEHALRRPPAAEAGGG